MGDKEITVEFERITYNQEFANLCASESSYLRIENYYPDIEQYTFPTISLPLSMNEALAIKRYSERIYQVLLLHDLQAKRQLGQWDEEKYNAADEQVRTEMESGEVDLLSQMAKRIDVAIHDHIPSGKAFIKLSTRSPKDSAFSLNSMKQLIEEDIKNSKYEGGTPEANAEDITIFYRASCRCLCITTGDQAVTLLIRSKRVLTDIVFAELSVDDKNSIPLSLVLREWNDIIKPEWEFRVFISKNKLTAATQYTDVTYLPEMVAKKDEISAFIQNYWHKVKDSIKCDSYTMDLALDPNLESAFIVELNSPPPTAGCSLFDWDNPKDRAQLEFGDVFELRIASSLKPTARDDIHQPLRRGLPPVVEQSYKYTSCSSCSRYPITKTYYHCDLCDDYDACVDCVRAGAHSKKDHAMEKIVCGPVDEDKRVEEKKVEVKKGGGWLDRCIVA